MLTIPYSFTLDIQRSTAGEMRGCGHQQEYASCNSDQQKNLRRECYPLYQVNHGDHPWAFAS